MDTSHTKTLIFDFNRTLYDPERGSLMPGAEEVLQRLAALGSDMFLVSKLERGREDMLDMLGIRHYFKNIFFVEAKTPALFDKIIAENKLETSNTYVVGDYLHEEIRCGNMCGVKTIYLKQGRFSSLEPQSPHDTPWRTIFDLREVPSLL